MRNFKSRYEFIKESDDTEELNNVSDDNSSEISILKEANSILKRYKNSPAWNDIITTLNNNDIEYENWNDLEILYFYLGYSEDLNESNNTQIIDKIYRNLWNYLVTIINKSKDNEVKKYANMLLGQIDTAGGKELMKDDVTNFIYNNRALIPELNSEIRNEKIDDIID